MPKLRNDSTVLVMITLSIKANVKNTSSNLAARYTTSTTGFSR